MRTTSRTKLPNFGCSVICVLVLFAPFCRDAHAGELTATSSGGESASKSSGETLFSHEEWPLVPNALEDGSIGSRTLEEPGPPADFAVRARLLVEAGIDTRFDGPQEHVGELNASGSLEISGSLAHNIFAYASPWFSHLSGVREDGTRRHFLFWEMPEAYVRWTHRSIGIRAGTLVVNWGSSDLIAPIDVINPTDYRRQTVALREPPKLPLLAVEGTLAVEPVSFKIFFAPFFAASRFFVLGWDDSMAQLAQATGLVFPDLEGLLSPASLDRLGDLAVVRDRPDDSPENGTLAVRSTLTLDDADISLSFVHGWEAFPRIVFDPDFVVLANAFIESATKHKEFNFLDPAIFDSLARIQDKLSRGDDLYQGSYSRRTVLGTDVAVSLDPFVVKADVAYTFKRTLYSQSFFPAQAPWLNATLGGEYFFGDRLQLIVEGFVLAAFDVPNDSRLMLLEPFGPPAGDSTTTRTVAVFGVGTYGRYAVWDGDLTFELAAIVTGREDRILQPVVRLRLDDHHQLSLRGVFLGGAKDSYGGLYFTNNKVMFGWQWSL